MALGDIFFLDLDVYACNLSTRATQFLSQYPFYLPCAGYSTNPVANKQLVNAAGDIQDYFYNVFEPWCPDYSYLTAIYWSGNTISLNFNSLFPNVGIYRSDIIDITSPVIMFVNRSNGKVCAFNGSTSEFYNSITDFTNNNPYATVNKTLFVVSPGGGTGAHRGRVEMPFYTAIDENTGKPSAMGRVFVEGLHSTTGAVYTYEYGNPISSFSSDYITAFLTFAGDDFGPEPPPVPPDTDPYADGGYSGDGGGDGSFDLQNDSIDFPSLPTLSAVDTGLVSIYTPSLTQLKSLATFLWNANPTDVDWWKKLVANPLDLILGLSIVPVQVPAGAAQTIKVGLIDTGVSVTKAASQFVTVDCGSVTIQKNCGGSALDYSPFTKFSLYLPFIGTRTISCDDIMGRTVHVKYNVDLLSGGCTAMVKITGGPEDNELDAILYQYSGACAISIPLTGETFTNMITSTIQLAASIGATVATGGAAAGVSAASAANSLMSMKPIIERAGGVSGAAGQLGIMQPYLIAEVPRQSVPANCNQFTGYPSNMKATIGDLTGYTEVDIVYIKGIEATQAELDELESILKGGFII